MSDVLADTQAYCDAIIKGLLENRVDYTYVEGDEVPFRNTLITGLETKGPLVDKTGE